MIPDKRIEERTINPNTIMLHALKRMDEHGVKSLLIIDENEIFKGILSIGDIQRAIIKNEALDNPVFTIMRANPRFLEIGSTIDYIKNEMIKYRMEFMPVINTDQKIDTVYFWEDLFLEKEPLPAKRFTLPVVIMAGGLGTRLKPLTNVLPKPLIPIGERTILEEIMARFGKYGCNEFHASVNYKSELIEYYIKNLHLPFTVSFFKETKPLGTAGSLSMLKDKINSTFFVSNCDILIDQDYSEILEYHKNNKNEITIVAALKHFPIAYGTIETGEDGKLLNLIEKPELTFKINTGMYILEPHLLEEIPSDIFFHITQLIENVKKRNGNIGVFPVSEKAWVDIGDWNEYYKIMANK